MARRSEKSFINFHFVITIKDIKAHLKGTLCFDILGTFMLRKCFAIGPACWTENSLCMHPVFVSKWWYGYPREICLNGKFSFSDDLEKLNWLMEFNICLAFDHRRYINS